MHKHLSTFLYVTIGSFSFAAFAMEKPKPIISERVFPNPLPAKLTQEEEAARIEFHKLIKEKLAAQYAAAKGISTVKPVDSEQSTEPIQEPEAQILYTNNIKPTDVCRDLENTSKECMDYLRRQIALAHEESARQNEIKLVLKQEETRQRQIALGFRKKVTAPEKMKDLVASTFAASQVAQAASAPTASSETASTAVVMPTLSVSVDSITRARVVCYAEPKPHEVALSTPAAPSYDELDALLSGVDMVASKRVASNIPSQELDQLLADLESFSPQSTNPLYEDPSAADLGPIQRVKVVDILTSRLESFEQKVTDLAQTAHTVFDMHTNTTDKETVQAAQHILIREITSMNQEIDALSHQLKLQPYTESLSAFNRLKNLTIGFKSGAENLGKLHQGVSISVPFISYTTCLESLIETISEKK